MEPIRDIIKARESIRKKYTALKRGESNISTAFETAFKPITTPLNKLVQKEKDRDDFENIVTPYLQLYASSPGDVDRRYGMKPTHGNRWIIGSKPVTIDKNDIIVDGQRFTGTRGLFELLTKKIPAGYDDNDLITYRSILEMTGAHRKANGKIFSSKGYKYKQVIRPLFATDEKSGGGGFKKFGNPIDYVYFDDLNELIERLKLLIASQAAGHSGHENEIISIIEELREAKVIR